MNGSNKYCMSMLVCYVCVCYYCLRIVKTNVRICQREEGN